MGCNCKSGKSKPLNNLQSVDHMNLAREVYNTVITQKEIEEQKKKINELRKDLQVPKRK
jgi:predicted nucleic acid-binding protein